MARRKNEESIDFGSTDTKRWLDWCENHPLVKCTEHDIPQGILPKNYRGTLIDVKVQGKKGHGPDDKIYSAHEDLRQKVARGNSVLRLHQISAKGTQSTEYIFMVFALRKFSGGMGDEDDDNTAVQNMWQNYFIKPVSAASKVVCTQKANGEAAHVSYRRIEDTDIFCIGSKNVHLLARNADDLSKYKDSRFLVAKHAAEAFFRDTIDSDAVSELQKQDLLSYLNNYKHTIVAELLQPAYQHVENLSYLKYPELRFICWTQPYTDEHCENLCGVSPDKGIDQARTFGLKTVDYSVISASEADEYMTKVRGEKGYEGRVMYFLDEDENVLGLIKKKTAWYILLRSIREKTCYACNPKAFVSSDDIDKKISKRINEIQTWLGFSDQYKSKWRKLGIAFAEWAVKRIRKQAGSDIKLGVRAQFPVLWQKFLDSNEELRIIYENLSFT